MYCMFECFFLSFASDIVFLGTKSISKQLLSCFLWSVKMIFPFSRTKQIFFLCSFIFTLVLLSNKSTWQIFVEQALVSYNGNRTGRFIIVATSLIYSRTCEMKSFTASGYAAIYILGVIFMINIRSFLSNNLSKYLQV